MFAVDINECEAAGGNDVCGVLKGAGVCINEVNRFICHCKPGYIPSDPNNPSSACGLFFLLR